MFLCIGNLMLEKDICLLLVDELNNVFIALTLVLGCM